MTIHDRNLTGATPAEPGRVQETRKPTRNQGVEGGNCVTGKTGDRVELSSTLELFPTPCPNLNPSAPTG